MVGNSVYREIWDTIRRLLITSAHVFARPGSVWQIIICLLVALPTMKLLSLLRPMINQGNFILADTSQTTLAFTLLLTLFLFYDLIPRSSPVGFVFIFLQVIILIVAVLVIRRDFENEQEFWSFVSRRVRNPKRSTVTTRFGTWKSTSFADFDMDALELDPVADTEEESQIANAARAVELADLAKTPGAASVGKLHSDAGVVGVPKKRPSRSTTPQPFMLGTARNGVGIMSDTDDTPRISFHDITHNRHGSPAAAAVAASDGKRAPSETPQRGYYGL